MKLTWFGHSAFRVEYAGAVIMLDPFIANPTFKGDVKAAYAGATHVMLSHGHNDHIGSTVEICKATGALLIANPEVCDFLSAKGVTNVSPFNHGGELHFDSFSVAYVPAWHSSSNDAEGGDGRYLGNPGGVVLMSGHEKPLLHMGDTGIFEGMRLIAELYDPKIGIVPIGDRFTMGGRHAAIACRRFFEFETVIPCHYGTFGLLDPTADKFITEMKGAKTQVLVPERGVAVELSPAPHAMSAMAGTH
jgi:L-ascorbate metabolism protein UlaG (beta-lactamase superfamily)